MYEPYYKFKAKPFSLSPDPRFFFGSSGHKRVLAYLRYGIHQGEGFIVVTGDVGTGKTTLVRTLLRELANKKDVVAAQLLTTQLHQDDLVRMVAAAFGLAYDGPKATVLKHLESFLHRQAEDKKRVLLVVDEAQNLSVAALEELRMLSNYQINHKQLLQSFLLGQAEFRNTLRSAKLEQLRQRVIASYHLGPMDLNDTVAYIQHRLRLVGWQDDPGIDDDAYKAIYLYTQGVPRRINALLDRILLFAYMEESHAIDKALVQQVIDEIGHEPTASGANGAKANGNGAGNGHGMNGTNGNTNEDPAARIAELEQRVANMEAFIRHTQDFFKTFSEPH